MTGASSGIGRATVARLAAKGYDVVAGVRREQDVPAEATGHVIMDLAEPESVATACKQVVVGHGDRLAGVVNNAGINVNGPFEVVTLDEWRQQFEVNFFGHLSVTRELLPTLLETRGRVVTVGSISGRLSAPFLGPYSASKFAVRAWSDALRLELAPHGVPVVLVEPGAVATPIWDKGNDVADRAVEGMTDAQSGRYAAQFAGARRTASFAERHAVTPDTAAAAVEKALTARNPRGRYLVGADARLQALVSLLPSRGLDAATRVLLRQPR